MAYIDRDEAEGSGQFSKFKIQIVINTQKTPFEVQANTVGTLWSVSCTNTQSPQLNHGSNARLLADGRNRGPICSQPVPSQNLQFARTTTAAQAVGKAAWGA